MKTLILIVTVLATQFAMAQNQACQQEAQIIAKAGDRSTDSLTFCSYKIDPKSIVHYNVNQLCPLDLDEVLAEGISVGLTNGHDCDTPAPGTQVSGILIKTRSGAIVFE